jgi:hypothetical protein
MAVGFPTKVTYANGDVFSASDINDTNGTINLLGQSVTTSAGKNAVINGGMDVWQRGTSFSIAASTGYGATTYTADRWQTATNANQAITVSRQTTSDTTNLPNIQYCARYQRNSGQTGTGALFLTQSFETVNSLRYVGQAVTFSFYARRGANYSAASNGLVATLYGGTGTDQNLYVYSGTSTVAATTATLTTTWQRFTATGTMATTATELAIGFSFTPVGTAGVNDYFEVTGVQVELGSTVTTFARTGSGIQGELAACQRYYQRSTSGTSFGSMPVYAVSSTSTIIRGFVSTPVSLRTIPTAVDFSALGWETNFGGSVTSISNATFYATCGSAAAPVVEFTTTGVSASPVYYTIVTNNNAAGYLGLSAEL